MMPAASLITQARRDGVQLVLSATGVLKAVGSEEAVRRWLPAIRNNKAAIIQALATAGHTEEALVREFMEVDGLSREEAQAMAAISIAPKPKDVWLRLIAELDHLIDEYCFLSKLSTEARERIMEARFGQSLSSVPAALEWFRKEVAQLRSKEHGKD